MNKRIWWAEFVRYGILSMVLAGGNTLEEPGWWLSCQGLCQLPFFLSVAALGETLIGGIALAAFPAKAPRALEGIQWIWIIVLSLCFLLALYDNSGDWWTNKAQVVGAGYFLAIIQTRYIQFCCH